MNETAARQDQGVPMLLRVTLITAVYLLGIILTRWLVLYTEVAPGVSPWYPPAGVALAVAIRYGLRYTPLIILGAAASQVVVSGGQFRLPEDIYYSLGFGLFYGVGGAMMRRLLGLDAELKRNRDLWMLLLGSSLLTCVASYVGVSLSLPDELWLNISHRETFLRWWVGDAVGVVVMTPFLLTVLLPQAMEIGRWLVRPGAKLQRTQPLRGLELTLQCSATVVAALAVFGLFGSDQNAMRYLCFIPLIWMAWRSGVPGASIGVTLFSFATIAAISSMGARPSSVIEVQLFTLLVGAAVLLLGASVTQRQVAERAYQSAEARLSSLMERAPVVIYARKAYPPYSFTYISGSARTRLGVNTQAVLDDPAAWEALIHPDDRGRLRAFIATALGEPQPFVEYRLQMEDGNYRWVRDVILSQPDGTGPDHPREFTGSLVDVHDSRVAEDALRQSEAMLSASQQIAKVGGWSYDIASGKITWTDETFRIFGRTPGPDAPAYEDHVGDLVPEDHDQYFGLFERSLKSGKPFVMRARTNRPDGSQGVVESHGQPMHNTTGELVGFSGTVQDITERVRAEQEQARLQEELRQSQKLEAIGTLASGVAHDVNNLLTAITGYAELARDKLTEGSEADDAIAMIEEVARQGTGVTRSMLTFGRRAPTHRVATDLYELADQSVTLLRRLVPASITIDVRADAPREQLWARVDADQLQQIFMNLVVNARDAMHEGGRVDMVLGSGQENGEPVVVLTVSDTGCGMDAEQLERVFEPFFTTKARTKGTGLGLSLVHGVVTEHNGRIEAHSKPGEGSRFVITLPACSPISEPERNAPGDEAATDITGCRVLLAEDNEFVRDVVTATLDSAGYQVVAYSDGEAAYRDAGVSPGYDLAIIDLDLPGRHGQEVIDRLHEVSTVLPVVVITGNRDDLGRDQPSNVHLLTKPFTVTRLLKLTDDLCRAERDRDNGPDRPITPDPEADP